MNHTAVQHFTNTHGSARISAACFFTSSAPPHLRVRHFRAAVRTRGLPKRFSSFFFRPPSEDRRKRLFDALSFMRSFFRGLKPTATNIQPLTRLFTSGAESFFLKLREHCELCVRYFRAALLCELCVLCVRYFIVRLAANA